MGEALSGPKGQGVPAGENLFKALLLSAALAGLFLFSNHVFQLDSPWRWILIAVLAIVEVVILTGMGVLAHDAVHRVLFRTAFWNELWGGLLSALVLIPFQANPQVHP